MSSFAANAACADNTLCSRELMKETVNVMNRALHTGQEQSVDRDGRSLAHRISNGKTLRVIVFDAADMTEKDEVAIRFDEDRVEMVDANEAMSADSSVKICEEHLVEVANDPATFVEDPVKIDLVWMKERVTETEGQTSADLKTHCLPTLPAPGTQPRSVGRPARTTRAG